LPGFELEGDDMRKSVTAIISWKPNTVSQSELHEDVKIVSDASI
jgi:hypothetical protein